MDSDSECGSGYNTEEEKIAYAASSVGIGKRKRKKIMATTTQPTASASDDSCCSSSKKGVKAPTRLTEVTDRTMQTLEKEHPGVFVKKVCGTAAPTNVLCTVCNSTINIAYGTKECSNHVGTKKHVNNIKARKGQKDLFSSGMSKPHEKKDPALDAEIIMSQWIAGSNLPFVKATELVQ